MEEEAETGGRSGGEADLTLYRYGWRNNEKRVGMCGRVCRVVCRGRMNSAMIEFLDNGQREVVSRNALRRVVRRSLVEVKMIDYGKPTPETDFLMNRINGDEIDLEMVRAALHDMEIERNYARSQSAAWRRLAHDAAIVLSAHAVGHATQRVIEEAEDAESVIA